MMYFSRLVPDLADPAVVPWLTGTEGPQADHRLIWRLMDRPADAERSFLFRRFRQQGTPAWYVVDERPVPQRPGWSIASKPFAPQLEAGQQLEFSVRVNPVITRREGQSRQRHDLVMDEKHRKHWRSKPRAEREPLADLVRSAGVRWLTEPTGGDGLCRAERAGFRVEPGSLACDGYHQHRLPRRGGRAIALSTLDLAGVLEVVDPERLHQTLQTGLGHGKAFGCGLLLLKPLAPSHAGAA